MQIGYARVSSADQRLDLQMDALTRAGCERLFTDHASGGRADRPGLLAAQSHLRRGDTLVVWKLDRLGRSVRQLVELVATLEADGVHFASITDGIDTATPAGRFFFHVMAALAEMERDLIRERTTAGLRAAKARGRLGGRRPKLTAQQLAHARKLLADPDTTGAEVAETFGVARSTLYRSIGRRPRGRSRTKITSDVSSGPAALGDGDAA
ncbi:recombinase family protein [Phenylobacterium sp.]|uniref:recombinase family protein n=1 Tax=Phenylobacterium sp. TaxID=1871053 RepID=UPI0035B1F10A